ncbi:MAG: 1,6-anhydro-N-acetylmuramyl-L-alanine amidase AmpD [Gammaproteobacteria bacterium]|jgi:AmpD protein|nr:1,6-anhydro-N-acetylmuramyl-L-alanine amidase AmpD [Gammaproteobacteria bacterium]
MLHTDVLSGWTTGARRAVSPNCDDRPAGCVPEVLVIHSISLPPDCFGGPEIEDFFHNRLDCDAHPYFDELRQLRVSSHFLVRRDGELVQFVPVTRRAWHAGESVCEGRNAVNDFSVGIELEGGERGTFEPAQYRRLVELSRSLMTAWPAITPRRVYGHADIAPGRKTDPGPGFDWIAYFRALA